MEVWIDSRWRVLRRSRISSWDGCEKNYVTMPISLSRFDKFRSQRQASRASIARWAYQRCTTVYVNKRCCNGWSRSFGEDAQNGAPSGPLRFEPVYDEANFGYRRGRSTKDALAKVWREIKGGSEWIVDADLKDFFGSVEHEKLLTLVAQRVADGRVLRLIKSMLTAGSYGEGRLFPTERGTPQGGVISPLMSNILLTPFDQEMRRKGYRLTRYADDWVITCQSAAEARAAIKAASKILKELGVELHPQKTRIVHIAQGFEFLGYKIKRGKQLRLPAAKIRSGARSGALYAYPKEKSIRRFMDEVRKRTKRRIPLRTRELIEELNPLLRGWGEYYKKAHVRLLFNRLDRWIVRRIRSHRFKRWRNGGWRQLPETKLYGEYGLVNLIGLIPSITSRASAST